ncbi:hypothetical protein [Lunatibacter salilacus]|uniref:hypothetical protein n=1 Tax=Lunatibacter salilacus TaxID=2483804 RepID=UPI00131C63A6|nr:hypothetical protein [Lunatibacter salilacus]
MNIHRGLKFNYAFIVIFGVFLILISENGFSQSSQYIGLSNGIQGIAGRDLGFSQLKYTGIRYVLSLGYEVKKPNRSESLSLNFAKGTSNSRGGNSMETWSLGLVSHTLYHRDTSRYKGFRYGWSLQNELNHRLHQRFANFNNRMDYFTSVGPAIGYLFPISWEDKKLGWNTKAHMQGVGFKFASDYISSVPPVIESDGTVGDSLWYATDVFWIGRDWSVGCWSEIRYETSSGNSLGVQYQFDFQQLSVAQEVIRVRNSIMLNICVRL